MPPAEAGIITPGCNQNRGRRGHTGRAVLFSSIDLDSLEAPSRHLVRCLEQIDFVRPVSPCQPSAVPRRINPFADDIPKHAIKESSESLVVCICCIYCT